MAVRNEDCASQILVIPASSSQAAQNQARGVIDAILAGTHESKSASVTEGATAPSSSSSSRIFPWHISNRYYEADVHFKLAETSVLPSPSLIGRRAAAPELRTVRLVGDRDVGLHAEEKRGLPPTTEDDAALAARVRNVFEALDHHQMPLPGEGGTQGAQSTVGQQLARHKQQFQAQIAGVQAVVILVDRNQPRQHHREVLSFLSSKLPSEAINDSHNASGEDSTLLSGFDLAVSLVVALPPPVQAMAGDESLPMSTKFEGPSLESLYAGEGWEFIDLAKEETESPNVIADQGEEDEPDFRESKEEEGVDRIREALMTHTWPGLIRQTSRVRRQTLGAPAQQFESERQSAGKETVPEDADTAEALASLRLQMNSTDAAAEANEPTQRDKELAEAFLAQIRAAESKQSSQSEASVAPIRSDPFAASSQDNANMQEALEKFLENEDASWPQPRENVTSSTAVWPQANGTAQRDDAPSAHDAFEDDFSDFITASVGDGRPEDSAEDTSSNDDFAVDEQPASFEARNFPGFRDDDELLTQSLAEGGARGDDLQLDFEGALSAVMVHAERVRAISDYEARRQEAARVALALLDQQ